MNTLLLLLACAGVEPGDSGEPPGAAPPLTVPLDAPLLLRRASLDLLGVLPPLEELERVEADPVALEEALDDLLADPRLEERLVDHFGERWPTRVEGFDLDADALNLEAADHELARAVGEEPLRLLAHVAAADRPWTDVVTADLTMATPLLAEIWPLELLGEGEGWQEARYTDGRPAGGVLMSTGMWWRYTSVGQNYNRSRAAAIVDLLLCESYLERPIETLDIEQAVGDDVADPVGAATCAACHVSLDPIASALFGFWYFDPYDVNDSTTYHPSREHLGDTFLGLSPAWFGQPFDSAAELGPLVAQDPRLVGCAVQSAAELLWGRPATLEDQAVLGQLQAAFEDGGLRYTALLRAVLDTSAWRAGDLAEGVDPDSLDGLSQPTRRPLSPPQLATALEDLSGYRWTLDGAELLRTDTTGYRLLAGGADGRAVLRPSQDHSVARASVIRRLAQAAAATAVEHDLAGGEPRLLTRVDLDSRPGQDDFEAQLVDLRRRLHGVPGSDEARQADGELWQTVEAQAGAQEAWTRLVSALLRDPAWWSY